VNGDLRVSMLLEANAAQARTEVSSVRKELTGLSTDAAAAGRAGAQSADGIARAAQAQAEWGSIVQMARAELQPMVGEYYGLVTAIQQVATAEEMGALTTREAALAHDLLARQANELMARMQAAGVTVDGTTAALQRHETAVQQLIAQHTGLARATEGTIADTLRHGMALDSLRAKYNPLFAASRQYEQELREIAEAERLGAISAMEAARAREQAALAMAPLPGHLQRFGGASQAAAAHLANLGFQLNDIGMMMSLGQSPFMLMMQQGPQVAQVLGQMRASGMAIGPAIAGAFGMMLNPVSLATLAIIGFGAAAVQWLGASAEAAETAEDAISRMADIRTGLAEAQRIEQMSLAELIEKYGTYALQMREAAKALKEFRLAQAKDALNTGVATANEDIGRYAGVGNASENMRRYYEAITKDGYSATIPGDVAATVDAVEALQRELNITEGDAIRLSDAFAAVQAAASFEDRLGAMQELQAALKAAGVDATLLPGPIRDALVATSETTFAMGELRGQIEAGVTSLQSMVAAAPGGGWLAGAIGDAGTLAGKLWDAWSAAAAVAAAQDQLDQMKVEFSPGGQAMLKYGSRTPGGTTTQNTLADRHKPKAHRGGGGGGGGAAEERDALADLIAENERQIATLRSTDPIQREILKNHEALANATDEEREKVEGLITERLRLEEVRDRLQEIEQAGKSAFTGLITGSMSFSEALSNVLMKLAEMAASDAWDILWGGGGGWGGLGGLIGGWLGGGASGTGTGTLGLPMPFAVGGKVAGPGGPTDDAVAAWLSNGEFVMNAAATAANQPLLEALNAGLPIESLIHWIGGERLAAMASGGYVGDSTGSSAPSGWRMGGGRQGGDPGGLLRVALDLAVTTRYDGRSGEFRAQVEEISRTVSAESTAEGLDIFRSHHLADAMAEIDANPRVRG
jgi:tetratricopeptide (TPR) repeat protein